MSKKSVKVAIVGLGFGAEFIPIYKALPGVELVAICQRNEESLKAVAEKYDIAKTFTSYEELLKDPEIEAVHLNTPIPVHAEQTIAALENGKHVACTVPMATSVEDCKKIVELSEEKNLSYMMMETVVYSREFLYMKELYDSGELGRLQFLKGSHQQDMKGWPDYWPGLPPMHYATHCVAPVLALGGHEAETISCFGSGQISEDLAKIHEAPFAVESCHVNFKDSDLSAHVYRSLFDTARQYRETLEVYGSKKTVEWPLVEGEELIVHTAGKKEAEIPEKVECPDFAKLLPKEIQNFTGKGVFDDGDNSHLSFEQGGGHGGSHPHLVHHFVKMLTTGKEAYPNARQSANITCVGILAHESAMKGGEILKLPEFTLMKSKTGKKCS